MISVASCSRKRPNELVSPEISGAKLQKTAFNFVLESESEDSWSGSGTESIQSIQSRSTVASCSRKRPNELVSSEISVASCSRKRPNELVSPEISGAKLQTTAFNFVLESESEHSWSGSGTESIQSIQSRSTEFVRDTSDTSSKVSEYGTDPENLEGVEYEVVSMSSDNNRPFDNISSAADSDPVELRKCLVRTSADDQASERSMWGDASSNADTVATGVNVKLMARTCLKCKARICFGVPLCNECFKVRKDFFPPRPKGRKNRNAKNNYRRKPCTKELARLPLLNSQESSGPSSQELDLVTSGAVATDNLCNVCYTNPKNGAFLHCRWVHIYACYQCSIKIWFTTKRCPLCHGKINSVRKVAIG